MNVKRIQSEIDKAYKATFKAEGLISAIASLFIYQDFDGNEPISTICGGGEMLLVYEGSELFIEEALEIMKERGFICKSDFPIYR